MNLLITYLETVITKLNSLKTKFESTLLSNPPRLPKQRCFGKVPRLRPSALLVTATVDEDEYGAMTE
jgi:hypothetical protein